MAPILTDKQKKSPLMKYYDMDIAPAPQELVEQVMKMSYSDNTNGLPLEDINKLFDDGYMDNEFGLFGLPNGGAVFANKTDMPGVTTEMFDWWFAWHGLDSLRYIIWDKDDHYYCQTQNVEQALDTSLSMKDRFRNTVHDLQEAVIDGKPPMNAHLHFVDPVEIGFDPEKLKDFKGTIVCTPGPPAVMIHFLRPTANGSELRTRFYTGFRATPNGPEQLPDFKPNDFGGRAMLLHNIKEFRHLAEILPSVYAEYKDNFTVDLD